MQDWIELQALCWALDREGGNKTRSAKLLEINFGTLRAKLRKHGIKVVNGKAVTG
jgi:DNA-binding protein Fis